MQVVNDRVPRAQRIVLWILAGLLTFFPGGRTASAQSGGCDTVLDDVYYYIDSLYTTVATDSANTRRELLGIPRLTQDQVGFVTDSATCNQAAAAYTLAENDSTNHQVYVFRLGSTRYLVVDRKKYGGEWLISWLFDASFTPIARLGT